MKIEYTNTRANIENISLVVFVCLGMLAGASLDLFSVGGGGGVEANDYRQN